MQTTEPKFSDFLIGIQEMSNLSLLLIATMANSELMKRAADKDSLDLRA